MANYHLSIKIFSRGKGHSAVEKAAYRAGEKLLSDYNGQTYDYTRKSGVIYTEIMLPEHAPSEYANRATLWNAVERIENNHNAQLAREIELSLPVELSMEQNISLTREYVQKYFVSAGMCADVCVHDKGDGNPHAHIMLTLRPIEPNGRWRMKSAKEYFLDENGERIRLPSGEYKSRKVNTVDWNEQTKAEDWRAAWADTVNAALERNGIEKRLDHRSYARQGVEQIPTVHMGVVAMQMERRGIRTERGNINREVAFSNKQLQQLRARIVKLQDWLADEASHIAQPALADVIQRLLADPYSKSYYQKISGLKNAAKMVNFLTENNIQDLTGLHEKVGAMHKRQADLRDKLKPVERRLKTLDDHIRQADYFQQFKNIHKQYQQQKPGKRDDFYESRRQELTLYEAADRYLKAVMNGKPGLPVKEWKAERDKLTAEKKRFYSEYTVLKDEIREVEQIRRGVEALLREGAQVRERLRDTDISL